MASLKKQQCENYYYDLEIAPDSFYYSCTPVGFLNFTYLLYYCFLALEFRGTIFYVAFPPVDSFFLGFVALSFLSRLRC